LKPGALQGPLAAQLAEPALAGFGDWSPLLRDWRDSAAGQATLAAVDARLAAGATVYPADVLAALRLTPRASCRVLILGQDPYHGPGQAEGLAFSVPPGVARPPSLRNMHTELQRDLGLELPDHGSLRGWAAQGVLLLNTTLTVEDGRPGSHAGLGWQTLTSAVCQSLWHLEQTLVVLLWGSHAQKHWAAAVAGLGNRGHAVLACNHPSPLSARRPPAPFVGCGHFSAANRALLDAGRAAVDWALAAAPAKG
jgi:uracil-DNA glycosylase